MNDDVFVAKGYEHIWASSGHRLKWAFSGSLNDVEARAYVRTASYAPELSSMSYIGGYYFQFGHGSPPSDGSLILCFAAYCADVRREMTR